MKFVIPSGCGASKACLDFGCRRQLSVFLCHIIATDLLRLKANLENVTEPKED